MDLICRYVSSGCVLVLGAFLAGNAAHAQTVPSVVIVIDGSGSMWGNLPGTSKSKFTASSNALQETLKGLSNKPDIGLVAFGQKPRGGCNEVETLLEVQTYDPDRISGAIKQINPQGRGPVVKGLNKAGKILDVSAPPRNIFIINDDPDNCNKDICAAAKSLKQRLPDIRVHALTLAPKQADKGAMACLAEVTGGRVIEAANAKEAVAGMQAIMADINRDGSAPSTAPGATAFEDNGTAKAGALNLPLKRERAVPNTPGLMLQALLEENGAILQDGLMWKIIRLENNVEKVIKHTTESAPSVALQPGRYSVALRTAGLVRHQEIEVKEGRRTVAPFNLEVAAIALSSVLVEGGPRVEDAKFTISKIDGSTPDDVVWSGMAPRVPLIIKPGEYKLEVSAGRVSQSHAFSASAGEQINLIVPLNAGYLKIKTTQLDQALLVNSSAVVSIQTDDPTKPSGRRLVARSIQANPNFLLDPGTYYVKAEGAPSANEERVVIAAGQIVERILTVTRMRLSVTSRFQGSTTKINKNIRYRIWPSETNTVPALTSSSPAPEFDLFPGRYRIEARVGKQNAVTVRNFETTPSPDGKIVLDLDAGTVALKTPQLYPDTSWEIRDAADQTIWRTMKAQPTLTLKSGRYKVIAEVKNEILTRDILIESGRHINVEID
ncbi:MAG: VWA domain-containing protein [Pseudomonadota bacterium]